MAASFVLGEIYAAGYIKTGIFWGLLFTAILFFIHRPVQGKYAAGAAHGNLLLLLLSILCMVCGFCRFSDEEYRRDCAEAAAKRQEETPVTIQARADWIKETPYGVTMMLSQVRIREEQTEELKLYAYLEETADILPGDMIQAEGILEDFEKPQNPGEFDSFLYYRSLGLHYAVTIQNITAVRRSGFPVYRYLMLLRNRFAEILENVCTPKEQGIYQAMLLGEKTGLSEEIKELYSAGGISHILAISGLHIAVIGMGLYHILRRFAGFRSSGILAGAVMSLYVLMTGSAVSSCRAVIMFVIHLFSFVCGRSYDMLSAASAALIFLLWRNPMYLFNSGFQLSFAAVFAIGVLYPCLVRFTGAENALHKSFLSGIAVSFTTFPVLAWHFYEISPYSVLLNLVVIPCMTLVMLSGLLGMMAGFCNLWAGRFFIALGQSVLKLYEWLCQIIKLFPGSRMITGRPEPWLICVYYGVLAAGLILAARSGSLETAGKIKRRDRTLLAACILVALTGILCLRPRQKFYVCFLDVSQGDGIYMETPEHVRILVDGGSSDKRKLYEDSILPFLKYRGVSELDFAIVTHADEDHVSGLKALLAEDRIEVRQVFLPEIDRTLQDEAYLELISLAEKSGAAVGFLSAGDKLQSGLLEICCLHPYEGLHAEERNAYSTVLEVHYGAFDMLLTGDLDNEGEQFLARHMITEEREYEVLKVAHHGSRYSTNEAFLDRIKAGYAVISCGRKNRYGHPHKELMERLEKAGTKIFRTDELGAVEVNVEGDEIVISGYK